MNQLSQAVSGTGCLQQHKLGTSVLMPDSIVWHRWHQPLPGDPHKFTAEFISKAVSPNAFVVPRLPRMVLLWLWQGG